MTGAEQQSASLSAHTITTPTILFLGWLLAAGASAAGASMPVLLRPVLLLLVLLLPVLLRPVLLLLVLLLPVLLQPVLLLLVLLQWLFGGWCWRLNRRCHSTRSDVATTISRFESVVCTGSTEVSTVGCFGSQPTANVTSKAARISMDFFMGGTP